MVTKLTYNYLLKLEPKWVIPTKEDTPTELHSAASTSTEPLTLPRVIPPLKHVFESGPFQRLLAKDRKWDQEALW